MPVSEMDLVYQGLTQSDPALRYEAAKKLASKLLDLHSKTGECISDAASDHVKVFLDQSCPPAYAISGIAVTLRTFLTLRNCDKKSTCSGCPQILPAFIRLIRVTLDAKVKTGDFDELLDVWQSCFNQEASTSHLFLQDFTVNWSTYRTVLLPDRFNNSTLVWALLAEVTGEIVKLYAYRSEVIDSLPCLSDIAGDIISTMADYHICYEDVGQSEWFGGLCQAADCHTKPNFRLLRCIVSTVTRAYFIRLQGADSNSIEITGVADFFLQLHLTTSIDLVELMMEEDEDLTFLLLCCVEIHRRLDVSGTLSFFNINSLWVALLVSISWDHKLLLDWINSSETEFLLFMVRYLKLLVYWKEDFNGVPLTHPRNTAETTLKCRGGTELLKVTVCENLMGLDSVKTVRVFINGEVEQQHLSTKPIAVDVQSIHSRVLRVFNDLKVDLVKLQRHGLLNFNASPLVKLLSSYMQV